MATSSPTNTPTASPTALDNTQAIGAWLLWMLITCMCFVTCCSLKKHSIERHQIRLLELKKEQKQEWAEENQRFIQGKKDEDEADRKLYGLDGA